MMHKLEKDVREASRRYSDENLLIDRIRVLHGYHFEWRGYSGSGFGFDSQEDCRESFTRMLRDWGYTAPEWWQFWRWGERKPPDEVIEKLTRP